MTKDPRGTGRTTAMLLDIKEDVAIIIVHRAGMIGQINAMIAKHLPKNPDRHFVIQVVQDMQDCMKLRGTSLPIYMDHEFESKADPAVLEAARVMQSRSAARQ